MGKDEKTRIKVVIVGHLSSGKSTTTGHLIHKLGGIDKQGMMRLAKDSAKVKKGSLKYAWVLDKLDAERERGITMGISMSRFETTKYLCTVSDTPGHHEFIDKLVTGTSEADCAVLIIDSTNGSFEDGMSGSGLTREVALIASAQGVKQMICCCNKMDATIPKYSRTRYDGIVMKVSSFLKNVGYDTSKIPFIPISGFDGDNLIEKSTNFEWYKGPTLLEALDQINEPKRHSDSSEKIKFQSSNGLVFQLDMKVAMAVAPNSLVIQDVIKDNIIGLVPVLNVDSVVLEKVVDYSIKHSMAGTCPYPKELQTWDARFVDVAPNMLYHLIMAARYLNIPGLYLISCKAVADMIKDKTPDEIRKTLNMRYDFTPEEEEEIQREMLFEECILEDMTVLVPCERVGIPME